VFPINSIVVSAHIDELLAESNAERLARSARSTSRHENRIISAFKAVWSNFTGPVARPMTLPELNDYPFRG
jgi:hypothetical protein